MYALFSRFLPERLAVVTTAATYTTIVLLVFLLWDIAQAGFRYAEI